MKRLNYEQILTDVISRTHLIPNKEYNFKGAPYIAFIPFALRFGGMVFILCLLVVIKLLKGQRELRPGVFWWFVMAWNKKKRKNWVQ